MAGAVPFGRVVALQATSPIRESSDIEQALATFEREELDSLLSVCEVEDYFNWRIGTKGPEPINYDFRNRRMRQQIEKALFGERLVLRTRSLAAARAEQPARRQDRNASDGAAQNVPDRSPGRHQALCSHHA